MRDPRHKILDFIPWMAYGDARNHLKKIRLFVYLKLP